MEPTPPPGGGGSSQNVKVAVRVRPFNKRELGLGSKCVVEVRPDGSSVTIADPAADPGVSAPPEPKAFAFDYAFDTDSTQQDVYARVGRPLLEQALRGFNATVFAYGQTGRCAAGREEEGAWMWWRCSHRQRGGARARK